MKVDWIDVEKRLPKCEGYYLCSVCCADSNGGVPMVEVLFFNDDPATWEVFAQGDVVTAWTYLPEPYKYEEYI